MESLRCTNGSQGTSMGLPGDEPPWSVRIIPCTYTASRRIGSGIRRRQSPVVKGRRLVRRKGAGVLPCARAPGGGMRRLETPHAVYTMRRRTPCIHARPATGGRFAREHQGWRAQRKAIIAAPSRHARLGYPPLRLCIRLAGGCGTASALGIRKHPPDLPRGITPRGLP